MLDNSSSSGLLHSDHAFITAVYSSIFLDRRERRVRPGEVNRHKTECNSRKVTHLSNTNHICFPRRLSSIIFRPSRVLFKLFSVTSSPMTRSSNCPSLWSRSEPHIKRQTYGSSDNNRRADRITHVQSIDVVQRRSAYWA